MTGDCHVQFFGKGIDTYFQAQAGYEVTPLLFQSMYIIFKRGWLPILNIPILQTIQGFNIIESNILTFEHKPKLGPLVNTFYYKILK